MSRALSLKLIFLLLFIFNLNGQNQEASFLIGNKLPDAPILSSKGEHKVGVKTVHLVHYNQIDILNSLRDKDSIYDRPLTV